MYETMYDEMLEFTARHGTS